MSERRSRDKEQTVREILDASRRLFSERGLHGVSIRDIEQASGVSKGLILHHFASKEKLYEAVQDLLVREYIEMMSAGRPAAGDVEEMVRTAIRASFLHARGNREFRRLSLWSYLEGIESDIDVDKGFSTFFVEFMQNGQQKGIIRQDMDALWMPFIIKGGIEYYLQKERLIRRLDRERGGQDEELDERFVDALVRLFMKP